MNNKGIIEKVIKLIKLANTSKGRNRIIKEVPKKIQATKGSKGFIDQIKKLYRYFIDPSTSKGKKALIGAGLLYFIMPFDVVTDFIPVLGYLDDGVAIAYIWTVIEKELRNYEPDNDIIDITSDVEVIDDEDK